MNCCDIDWLLVTVCEKRMKMSLSDGHNRVENVDINLA